MESRSVRYQDADTKRLLHSLSSGHYLIIEMVAKLAMVFLAEFSSSVILQQGEVR